MPQGKSTKTNGMRMRKIVANEILPPNLARADRGPVGRGPVIATLGYLHKPQRSKSWNGQTSFLV